jgi:hypothetical protein
MHRTVEAIIHPDGHVEMLEVVASDAPRRALLTILDEPPVSASEPMPETTDQSDQMDVLLRAAGLLVVPEEISADLESLSEEDLDRLWARIPPGIPLSQIIHEEREERF